MDSLVDDHDEFVKSLAPRVEVLACRDYSFHPQTVRGALIENKRD
jgi:hypothetical protein